MEFEIFDPVFYNPIYNLVVYLSNHVFDLGIVIVLTTIIIKVILFPLQNKQINNQIATKKAKPELTSLAKKYKGKTLTKEEQEKKVKETFAIYKKYNIRPFSSILILFIQLPAIFALYWIFYMGGLPEIDESVLYSFVEVPKNISMNFLNIFPLLETSYFLAFVAAVTQFAHFAISMPEVKLSDFKKNTGKIKDDMMNSFQVNIKYGLPVLIFIMLITIFNSAMAIYWITSNIFMALQELAVKNKKAELKKDLS